MYINIFMYIAFSKWLFVNTVGLVVHRVCHVFVVCLITLMQNVKKIHGEEDDYVTKSKVSC